MGEYVNRGRLVVMSVKVLHAMFWAYPFPRAVPPLLTAGERLGLLSTSE